MGIYTFAVENTLGKIMKQFSPVYNEKGWGNGYVLLPKLHPFYNRDCNTLPITIHGGLTFGSIFTPDRFIEIYEGIELGGDVNRENYTKFDGYYMIGFDTAHAFDDLISAPKEYVLKEVDYLLEQCLDNGIDGIKDYKKVYSRSKKIKKINGVKGLSGD